MEHRVQQFHSSGQSESEGMGGDLPLNRERAKRLLSNFLEGRLVFKFLAFSQTFFPTWNSLSGM